MAGELILVVDDDPDIAEVLCCLLHDAGYEVLTAEVGAALPLAPERQPHVILLDLLMPGMDGVEMSRRLQADPTTAPIPAKRSCAADAIYGPDAEQPRAPSRGQRPPARPPAGHARRRSPA
jgi:CheY-like chemotaxis protein